MWQNSLQRLKKMGFFTHCSPPPPVTGSSHLGASRSSWNRPPVCPACPSFPVQNSLVFHPRLSGPVWSDPVGNQVLGVSHGGADLRLCAAPGFLSLGLVCLSGLDRPVVSLLPGEGDKDRQGWTVLRVMTSEVLLLIGVQMTAELCRVMWAAAPCSLQPLCPVTHLYQLSSCKDTFGACSGTRSPGRTRGVCPSVSSTWPWEGVRPWSQRARLCRLSPGPSKVAWVTGPVHSSCPALFLPGHCGVLFVQIS